MAIKDIECVKEMRENGMKYQDIANELGISRQQAWYIGNQAGITGSYSSKNNIVVYKKIRDWIEKHKMRLHDFCIKCGEKCGANSKTYKFLTGKSKGNIYIINNVLKVCGLTFEEAFGEVINGEKENKD